MQRVAQIIDLDRRDAELHSWEAIEAERVATAAARAAAEAALETLEKETLACVAKPPAIAWVHANGKPVRVMTAADVRALPDTIAPDILRGIREATDAYQSARAEARAVTAEAQAQVDELEDRESELEKRWMEAPAPHAAAVAAKFRHLVQWEHGVDLERPDEVAEALSSPAFNTRSIVHIYRDLCRLAGFASATADVRPFDVEEWVRRFEAFPGHMLSEHGIAYAEVSAFGGGPELEDAAFIVEDPQLIRAYHDRVAARSEEHAALIAQNRAERADYDTRPVLAIHDEHVEGLFADDPATRDEWMARLQRRRALNRATPLGAHLFRNLTDWQKELVREFGRQRDRDDAELISRYGRSEIERRRHAQAKAALAAHEVAA